MAKVTKQVCPHCTKGFLVESEYPSGIFLYCNNCFKPGEETKPQEVASPYLEWPAAQGEFYHPYLSIFNDDYGDDD